MQYNFFVEDGEGGGGVFQKKVLLGKWFFLPNMESLCQAY